MQLPAKKFGGRPSAAPSPTAPAGRPPVTAAEPFLRAVAEPTPVLTDILRGHPFGRAATDLPELPTPVARVMESLWVAVRQNRYGRLLSAPTAAAGQLTGQELDPPAEEQPDSVAPDVLAAFPDTDVSLSSDGTIHIIDGTFADTPVTSADDAAQLFNAIAPQLGEPAGFATAESITVQQVGIPGGASETFYRLQDSVDGVPVLGSEVILVTDSQGTVTGLFNNHDPRLDGIDSTADALIDDEREAIAAAALAYLSAPEGQRYRLVPLVFFALSDFKPELVIYALDADTPPQLAWRVVVDPPDPLFGPMTPGTTYYINANGDDVGAVAAAMSNVQAMSTVSTTADDVLGQSRTIDVAKLDLIFFAIEVMKDLDRNIATYPTVYLFWLGPPIIGLTPPLLMGSSGWDASAVSAQANMVLAYDYYANELGLESFDGKGASVRIAIDYNPTSPLLPFVEPYQNAFWDPTWHYFGFGDAGDYGAAVDIVAHEYTHAVVTYAVGGGGAALESGEPGALNEAYGDILGGLIEGKTGEDRWLFGEDATSGAIRSMADPSSTVTAFGPYREHYDDRYTGTGDDGGEHVNSTIFSHAAYLMMTDARTADISDETWAQLFYHSLYRLSPDAVFSDGRAAVIHTASSPEFNLTGEQQQAIVDAFDAVGIEAAVDVVVV